MGGAFGIFFGNKKKKKKKNEGKRIVSYNLFIFTNGIISSLNNDMSTFRRNC